jgi:hypothetical protein
MRLADIYVNFFLNDRELFRILMTFMLHTSDMNMPQDLNDRIVKTTNKTIGIIEQIFQYGVERGEFPATLNLRQNRNALWGMMNGIISLHLFTGIEEKRAEFIHGTIKAGLEIFIRGIDVSERQR